MELVDSFFESNNSGIFSLNDLSLSLRNDFPAGGFESIRALGSEEARIERWFTATAYFHEMRHFHDVIGTPSGLGLFLETTRLVDDLLQALAESGDNPVPLGRRAADAKATRLYKLRFEYLSALLGDESRPITPEEAAGSEYQVQDYRFAEMGLDFYLPLVPVPSKDRRTGKVVERQVPLGLRALLEYTATEIQTVMAAVGAGDDPHAADDSVGVSRRFSCILWKIADTDRAPYFLVHRMAQYHLTGKCSDPVPGLGSLMALTLAALDIGGYARVDGQGWTYEHPGQGFAHLLAPWRGGRGSFEADIDEADGFVAGVLGQSWRDFLGRYVRQMERGQHGIVPDHLAPQTAAMPLISDIREIALRDHLAIMRSKAQDLVPWVDPVRYVQSLVTFRSRRCVLLGTRLRPSRPRGTPAASCHGRSCSGSLKESCTRESSSASSPERPTDDSWTCSTFPIRTPLVNRRAAIDSSSSDAAANTMAGSWTASPPNVRSPAWSAG
jgi:hypothetical protein